MSIMGSVIAASNYPTFSAVLPRKNLTVVGIVVNGDGYITIPISPGRNAIFLGNGSSYMFTPVNFVSESGIINGTIEQMYSGGVTIMFFYGTPEKDSKPLEAFSGVANQFSFTLPASISTTTSISDSLTYNFPANATKITGAEIGFLFAISGVSVSAPVYVAFQVSTGETLYLPIMVMQSANQASMNDVSTPDYPNSTGVIPISVPISTSVTLTATINYQNSNTSSTTIAFALVLYYQ